MSVLPVPTADEVEQAVALRDPDLVEAAREVDALLQAHDTLVRDPAGRRLEPSPVALRGRGQMQLLTDLGPLDILCRLHDGRG